MLTARQAYANFMRNSSPAVRDRLKALEACNRIEITDERPHWLVAGTWPSGMPGAQRANCRRCGEPVALNPDSGLPAHKRFPDAPIVCFDCVATIVETERPPKRVLPRNP